MDDLIAFVTARLDEDEANANEVHLPRECGCVDRDGEFDPRPIWCNCARPARVLREVRALRWLATFVDVGGSVKALREIAAIWSDHGDYRPEWKPLG